MANLSSFLPLLRPLNLPKACILLWTCHLLNLSPTNLTQLHLNLWLKLLPLKCLALATVSKLPRLKMVLGNLKLTNHQCLSFNLKTASRCLNTNLRLRTLLLKVSLPIPTTSKPTSSSSHLNDYHI